MVPKKPAGPPSKSNTPALIGIGALLLALLGGGLYLSVVFSGGTDQPTAVRPGSANQPQGVSPGSSVSGPSSTATPVSFELAQNLFDGTGAESTDKDRAISMFEELSNGGSLKSQKRLAEIHAEGEMGDVDFKEAFKWLLMAAEQGDAESQAAVGVSYSTGQRGVSRDVEEAVRWLRESASQDFGHAQMMLGLHYSRGLGIEEDLHEAKRWAERAKSNGVDEADAFLADLEKQLRPDEITNSIGMKFRLIPAGEFMMGSKKSAKEVAKLYDSKESHFTDEHPRHRVKISNDFYLGKYEVTVGQFRRFVSVTGYETDAEKDDKGGGGFNPKTEKFENDPRYSWRDPGFEQDEDHPVTNVSWNDAEAFCKWLSKKDGESYRLPSEAEWEYSCRGGTTSLYHHGSDPEGLAGVGNVADGTAKKRFDSLTTISRRDGYVFTAPVGEYTANDFGLHDMHGNVWEWCSDWYEKEYYENSPLQDSRGPDEGTLRVFRGGSWVSSSQICRSAYRNRFSPDSRFDYLGFRVLRSSIK